ncbi:glycosyltransferase family 4 protein, partial [Algoriphagus sp. A40]|uniref:glycosyltransferase family 4 protein n=1 Tax=Algoriphagus sp. A40 TaxID=1945863 RepID=UPI0009863839
CEVIHFSSLFFHPTLILLLVGLPRGIKFVFSPRGELYPAALAKSRLQKKIYLFFLRIFAPRFVFHATNFTEANLIKKYFPNCKKIEVLPNYIPIRNLFFDIDQKKQILFLGRINEIKNIHLVLEAFSILTNKGFNVPDLLIVGSAILESECLYFDYLKKLVSDLKLTNHIKFLGHLSGDEKFRLIQESRCLILPSKSENFGNVVLESLMMGTPVIVSKGTPWEILEDRKVGFWINSDSESIANSLYLILDMDDKSYSQMRISAREFVISEFDISTKISKWEKFYKSL